MLMISVLCVNENPEQAIGSAGRGVMWTEYLGTGGLFLLYDTRRFDERVWGK